MTGAQEILDHDQHHPTKTVTATIDAICRKRDTDQQRRICRESLPFSCLVSIKKHPEFSMQQSKTQVKKSNLGRNRSTVFLTLASALALAIVTYIFLYALLAERISFAYDIPLPDERPPLAYELNQFVLSVAGKHGAVIAHILLSILCFILGIYIIYKIKKSLIYVIPFCIFYLSYLLWHEEVFTVRDTVLFALETLLFIALLLDKSHLYIRFALLGAISGLAWLTRATGIIFIPLLVIVTMTLPREKFAKRSLLLLIALVSFLVAISPRQLSYYRESGQFSLNPFPGNGLYNFFKGNNELSAAVYPKIDIDRLDFIFNEQFNVTQDDLLLEASMNFALESPLAFLAFKGKGIALFFAPIAVPFGSSETTVANGVVSTTNFEAHHLYQGFWIGFNLLPLMAMTLYLGYFLGITRRFYNELEARFHRFVLIITILFLLLHLTIWIETRFIMPLHPLWLICSSFMLIDVARLLNPKT